MMEKLFDYEKACELAVTLDKTLNELIEKCNGVPALERDLVMIGSDVDMLKFSLNID